MATADFDRLVALRRELHRHPEPAWREFYTTARIVEELERIGVDELYVGPEAIDEAYRIGMPSDESEFDEFQEWAIADGADPSIVEQLRGGKTGVVAVLDRGAGPHIGVRVDIDALVRPESDDPDHVPQAEGFRSEREGYMHACGHDAHATIGIGVLEAIASSEFSGKLTVGFQPAEEEVGGARAFVESGHFDDVDQLLAVHVGLRNPTGTVVAGYDGFLAVSNVTATFQGESAHAGTSPHVGRNAILSLATAIQNLHGIARHTDGLTRVNVGRVTGGTATNIIPEEAILEGEVRGGTTALCEFMKQRAERVINAAAAMHDCAVDISFGPEAPSGKSDPELAAIVAAVAADVSGVDDITKIGKFDGSEDATFLMDHVQSNGGQATYIGIGTDHPGGHHTATFDVDEESIRIGVDVLTQTILAIDTESP